MTKLFIATKAALFFTFSLLMLFFFTSHSVADEVYSKNQKANSLYKQGKYDEALKLYEDALLLSPTDTKLKMNKGSALYQSGQLDKAEEMYNSAISSDIKKEKADAHYNMGNILFRQGEQLQKSGNPSAKDKYQAALQHYIQTLDQRPGDPDAKWNLQLAHNRIKQVEQQQQQQKNDKNDKSKNDNNDQQNKDQNKNDQKQNDDKSKDQQNQDKKEQDKKDQQDKNDQNKQQQEQQKQSPQQQSAQDMKKEEAKRLIELYADDADSLNKPPKKTNASRQAKPEQDW